MTGSTDDTIIQTPDGPMTWAEWKKKEPGAGSIAADEGQEPAEQGEGPHRGLRGIAVC